MSRTEMPRFAMVFALLVGLVPSGACDDRGAEPEDRCTYEDLVGRVRVADVDKVDLLFMVDNSGSMTEEQVSLAMELPRLIQVLASGDQDGDGIEDFPPVKSLQVGVVTSDMGTGGFGVPTCVEPNFGDDGVLRRTGNTAIAGCPGSFATSFLTYEPGGVRTTAELAMDASCLAVVGTGGCGFEQQLEAALKAVTPSTQGAVGRFDGTFAMESEGHADGANGGFLRPDSLLVIIEVTDEDDCSALDPELFNPTSTDYPGDFNLRCFRYPEAVQPVGRYIDGLLATRPRPDRLVYAIIAGVPLEAVPAPGEAPDFAAILAHPGMVEEIDPDQMTRIKPSCNVAGRGFAFPPRRLVEVARGLHDGGATSVVQSICQADFTPPFDAIIAKIADALRAECLPRPLSRIDGGTVDCRLLETLPATGPVTRCDEVPGRSFVATDPDSGGQVCEVMQLPVAGSVVPAGAGWYYDDFSDDVLRDCAISEGSGHRISFTDGSATRTGTQVRLDCPAVREGPTVDIFSPCDPAIDGESCGAGATPASRPDARCARDLACDPLTGEWQIPCDADAACPGGFRCAMARGTSGTGSALPNICENPSC